MPQSVIRDHLATAQLPTLDGRWVARAATLGGVRLPPEVLEGLAMQLFNGTASLGGDVGTVDVDVEVSPATIDILILRGPNRWRFVPGIFQHRGHVLRICFDLSGTARPKAFLSAVGGRHVIVTYERVRARSGR